MIKLKYVRTENMNIVAGNGLYPEPEFKCVTWKDENGDIQNHPIMSIPPKYWKQKKHLARPHKVLGLL